MKRRSRAFACCSLGALLAGCATKHPDNPALDLFPAGVDGSTDITYYDIHGRTARELVAQLRQLGPRTSTGAFWAEAQSPMLWTYRTRTDGGERCSLTNVHILVHTEITMPRWVPPADTEPGVYDQWQESMAALTMHEVGHKNISAHAAREVLDRLKAISTDCNDIGTVAARATDAIMVKMRADQAKYDAETHHGQTQGVAFPPPKKPVP